MWPQRSRRSNRAPGAQSKSKRDLTPLAFRQHLGLEVRAEAQAVADAASARRPREGAPRGTAAELGSSGGRLPGARRSAVDRLMEGDLDPRHAAPAEQPRRDHARVVEHEQIAGPEQRRQIAHAAILERRAADHQQTGGVPWPRRMLRDQPRRQVEIEQIDAHGEVNLAPLSDLAQMPWFGQAGGRPDEATRTRPCHRPWSAW